MAVSQRLKMDNEFHTVRGYQLLQQNNRLLTSAMEDYLEMVCRNIGGDGYVRIRELAEKLNVRASSATKMIQKLGELGFIKYKRYGIIEVTEAGKQLGEYLLKRHRVIEQFLSMLGIKENLLVETELTEHHISPNTLKRLEMLNRFFSSNPELLRRLKAYISAHMKSDLE
jgi:DtxR family Mn-dependent transcriptional regulator